MKYISIIILAIMVSGCAAIGLAPPPSVSHTEDSVLCQISNRLGVQLEDADMILKMGAIAAMNDSERHKVREVYINVRDFLKPTTMYSKLSKYITDQRAQQLAGMGTIAIGRYVGPMADIDRVIIPWDFDKFMYHINGVIELLE